MEVALKRLFKITKFLNQKHCEQWLNQQSKQSSICGKNLQISSTPQQQSRSFSSNKTKMTDARKITRIWHTNRDEFTPNGKQINVISYNILAQDLLVGHLELYRNCNPLHLRWSYRLPRLVEEIVSYKPDILCMQEVQQSHLDEIAINLKSRLPMNFVYKKKTGIANDGCAIFFNKNLFDLVESDAVEYYQSGYERLDRHNIAVIAKLRCKSNPDYVLLVCTTHLLYNPRRQDVRLAQLMLLLAELDRHAIRFEEKSGAMRKLPLMLMGDFNFPPNSAPFELLSTGLLSYDKLARHTLTDGDYPLAGKMIISPHLGITDNCQHIDCVESNYKCIKPKIRTMKRIPANVDYKPVGVKNPNMFSTGTLSHSFKLRSISDHIANAENFGSTCHEEWTTVDHFFYSDGMGPNSSLELMASYELPSLAQCAHIPMLPNDEISSDHLLLAAKFNLVFSDKDET